MYLLKSVVSKSKDMKDGSPEGITAGLKRPFGVASGSFSISGSGTWPIPEM